MKKTGSLILVCLLLVSVFATSAQAKVTVQLWWVWPTSVSMAQELLKPFEAANPDIEVSVLPSSQGTAQREKLLAAILAGMPPDIVMMVAPSEEMARKGIIQPLDSLLAASKSIRLSDYAPGIFDLFKVGGKIYGVPGIEVGPWHGLVMNEDMFAASGMKATSPASLDELVQWSKKLTLTDGNQITQLGMSPLTGVAGNYFPEVWPNLFDLTLYDPVKRHLNINNASMKSVFEYLSSFFVKVSAAQVQDFDKRNGSSWDGLASGNLGMQVTGYYTVGNLTKAGATKNLRFAYGWMPNVRKDRMQVVGGWGMTIPQGAQHVKEAFRVMEYLTSAPVAKEIYAQKGWLNGNLVAMRQLDSRENPGIAWYIEALASAKRVLVPENIPVIADVRSVLSKKAWAVARGEVSPEQALSDAQIALDAALDNAFK